MPYSLTHAMPQSVRAIQARERLAGARLFSARLLAPCLCLTLSPDPMRLTSALPARPAPCDAHL